MNVMDLYFRAQDGFDTVLTGVEPGQWEAPSECAEWSVRDVAGHLIWGQRQLRAWATGDHYAEQGGPGSAHPAVVIDADPLTDWRAAREAATTELSEEALARPTTVPGIGEVPLIALVTLLLTDTVTHTWDIGHAIGVDVKLDPEAVTVAFEWSRRNAMRRPGFFGPELPAPDDADEQARMLAFLGRRP